MSCCKSFLLSFVSIGEFRTENVRPFKGLHVKYNLFKKSKKENLFSMKWYFEAKCVADQESKCQAHFQLNSHFILYLEDICSCCTLDSSQQVVIESNSESNWPWVKHVILLGVVWSKSNSVQQWNVWFLFILWLVECSTTFIQWINLCAIKGTHP